MKTNIWDIAFIVIAALLLVTLSETNYTTVLIKFPLITIYASYFIGRYVGHYTNNKDEAQEATNPEE